MAFLIYYSAKKDKCSQKLANTQWKKGHDGMALLMIYKSVWLNLSFSLDNIPPVTSYALIHVLSRHFLIYFEILTSLSFEVPCPFLLCHVSDCLPWFPVFPPVPLGSSCAQIVCVSLVLCQCVVICHVTHSSVLVPQNPVLSPWACSVAILLQSVPLL